MMKKLLKLIPFLLVAAMFASCSDDDNDETCDILDETVKPSQCKTADISVCTSNETYYIFNGKKYDINGKLIGENSGNTSEISDLVLACDPNASAQQASLIQMQFNTVTQQLINEARAAAICD